MLNNTKIHRENNKKWKLPTILHFRKTHSDFGLGGTMNKYDVLGYRKPKAGEYYLSGAKITAYYSSNDLNTEVVTMWVEK